MGRDDQPIHNFKVGDTIRRRPDLDPENPAHYTGLQLSVKTTYKVLWVHPITGVVALENFMMLVHPECIYFTTQE